VYTTSRFVATTCASSPFVATDYFDCKYPLAAAAENNTIGFCDYAPDYSDIFVSCYGQCIHCISQHGPRSLTGGTQCRPVGAEEMIVDSPYSSFWSGDLYLNCRFMHSSTELVKLYDRRDAIRIASGNTAVFTCYDAYLTNATIQLDTFTGAWITAGNAMSAPGTFATQRRLLEHFSADDASDTSEPHAGKSFVGHGHQFLDVSSLRIHAPIDRMRTSPRATWMEGVHPLSPLYEHTPWIPLPDASTMAYLNADRVFVGGAWRPQRAAMDTSHTDRETDDDTDDLHDTLAPEYHVHEHAWFQPRPGYTSVIHAHRQPTQGSMTLNETIRSAHLLNALHTTPHSLFQHLMRMGHSVTVANKAMGQHFRTHQYAMRAHRNRARTHARVTKVGVNQGHPTPTHVRVTEVGVNPGHRPPMHARVTEVGVNPMRRKVLASLEAIGTSTRTVTTAANTTVTITSYNLPNDPLAFSYAPVCTDVLTTCGHDQLHCTHYDRYYVDGRRNRNTYCMNNLINSCHTPNQTRPETYTLSCPSGVFTPPHTIVCTYDRTDPTECLYVCRSTANRYLTLAAYPIPASLILDESLDTTIINGASYNYRCDYVMHTATSIDLRHRWYDNNFFWCIAPMEPVFLFPTNATSDTRHRHICYDTRADTRSYTLNCGIMTLSCIHHTGVGLEAVYNCTSTERQLAGVSDMITTEWIMTDVPVVMLVPGSAWNVERNVLTVESQCVALRTRTLALTSANSQLNQYTCVKDASATYIRIHDDATAVCTVVYDASGSIASGGLRVPLLVCPRSGIIVNCTFVPVIDNQLDVYTGRFVCRTDMDARSSRNRLLTTNHQFAMACTTIDPMILQSYGVTYMRSDGGIRAISSPSDMRLAIESQDACMYIKRNCDTPTLDYFGCNTIFAQDTSRNEFCDISPAPVPVEFPIFTCGTAPVHAIFCSNHNTALNHWVRCQNVMPTGWVRPVDVTIERLNNVAQSQEVLTVDCSISIGVMTALHSSWASANPNVSTTDDWISKPDMCTHVRILCGFQVTTAPVISVLEQINAARGRLVFDTTTDSGRLDQTAAETIGNAGTYLSADELLFDPNDNPRPSNNTFQCRLPALLCTGVFCQVSLITRRLNDSSPPTYFMSDKPYNAPVAATSGPSLLTGVNVTDYELPTCRPPIPQYLLQCQGVPISCTLYTTSISGLTFSSYRCVSTHTSLTEIHDNAQKAGLAWPYVSQDGFGCGIDMVTFDAIESPTTLCMAIGARCVEQRGVSCISGFLPTKEAPFCTLRTQSSPGNPMFECSDLAVSCQWDSIRNWMFCTSQPGSAVWSIGSRFASPPRADGRTGCVISSSSSDTADTSNVVRFYQNVAQRCTVLDQLCKITCFAGYHTRYDADGHPSFCEPDAFSNALQQTFVCDDQKITCGFTSPNRTRSASIAPQTGSIPTSTYVDETPTLRILYMSDPDYGRHHRVWQCQNVSARASSFPDSLRLDCKVSGEMLQYDSCSAILGGCRTNGTLQCLGDYRATQQKPFCTTKILDFPASEECDCGVWWSNELTTAPSALLAMMAIDGEDEACASRGYMSTRAYLRECANDPSPKVRAKCAAMDMAIFGSDGFSTTNMYAPDGGYIAAKTPWKQSWCVWNYTQPTATCAIAPGKRLPLCTIECPDNLFKTRIDGGATEYCCADPRDCRIGKDARNCVLGKHENAWYDPSLPLLSVVDPYDVDENGVPREPLQRTRTFFPDRICPRNILSTYTAYPVVTRVRTAASASSSSSSSTTTGTTTTTTTVPEFTSGTEYFRNRIRAVSKSWFQATYATSAASFGSTPVVTVHADALQYSHARDLCWRDVMCWGFTVVMQGLYFLSRPPALPDVILRAANPRRLIHYDTEASYHLHRIPQSQWDQRATRMDAVSNAASFLLERSFGYACPSTTFEWLGYLETWPDAFARVEQRMMQHFHDAGVNMEFYTAMRFGDTTKDLRTLSNITMISTAGALCSDTTGYTECVPSSALQNLTAFTMGNVSLLLDANSVSAPTATQHRYKRIFFVNLIAEDIRDGVPLDEYGLHVRGQTIREFANSTLFPEPTPDYVEITSDLVSQCRNIYLQSTTPQYTGLLTQKSHAFSRRIPVWGTADGTTTTKVYLYNQLNGDTHLYQGTPSRSTTLTPDEEQAEADAANGAENLFRDKDASVSPYLFFDDTSTQTLVDASTLVGWIDIPDTHVFFIEFSSFWALYGYYAWRDWSIHGHMSRGDARISPNRDCRLNTPLWYDSPYVEQSQMANPLVSTALHLQPMCVVPRCPMPIAREYLWPTTRARDAALNEFPDPADTTIAKDWNSVPCDGQGVCHAPHLVVPQGGTCACDTGSFLTVDSMDQPTYDPLIREYHTPRSLQNRACGIDTRDGCYDTESQTVGSCSNNGMCVTAFVGFSQTARCKCGRFPQKCHVQTPRTCERDRLEWETNGFDERYSCNAPRLGCRNATEWNRPPGTYLRTASYGCEKVRSASPFAGTTGTCTRNSAASPATDGWMCTCKSGFYGNQCQYISLDGGCFDKAKVKSRSDVQTCYFHPEIGQYQMWSWFDPAAFNLIAPANHVNVSCRGIICSGRGTCSHALMNSYTDEVYNNPSEFNNLAIAQSPAYVHPDKALFQEKLRQRLAAQKCTCAPGFSGTMCELQECASPCLNNALCINKATTTPRCDCPKAGTGTSAVSLTSDTVTCGGIVCGGRGTLTRTVQASGTIVWSCACFVGWVNVPGKYLCESPSLQNGGITRPSTSGGGGGGGGSSGRASSSGAVATAGSSGMSTIGGGISSTGSFSDTLSSSGTRSTNTTRGGDSGGDSSSGSVDPMPPGENDAYLTDENTLYDTIIPLLVSTLVCAHVLHTLFGLFHH
jgi:hypothetical protein